MHMKILQIPCNSQQLVCIAILWVLCLSLMQVTIVSKLCAELLVASRIYHHDKMDVYESFLTESHQHDPSLSIEMFLAAYYF